MKTLPEIIQWLKQQDHIRVLLVEVEGVKIQGVSSTLYLSNKAFTSTPTDTPANTCYDPCVVGGISFSESISLDGTPSIGFGDIEIENIGGIRDTWLDYIWANRTVNIYIGDPRWYKNDYYKIFSGVVSDIASRDNSKLNLILLDKLERLNKPISEDLIGGTGNNKDVVKPLVFGECFNVSPVSTDSNPNQLEYIVHNGNTERLIEVRDNGVPLVGTSLPTFTAATGKFVLTRSPAGQITASVQGSTLGATYSNKVADIIKYIVKNYGPTETKLTDADIDLDIFNDFNAVHTQPVGIFCNSRENILDVCQQLAYSVGAGLAINSSGKLALIKLAIPGTSPTLYVTPNDMEFNSISVTERSIVKGSVKLGYCRNWSVQEGTSLAGGVPSTHAQVYALEYGPTMVEDTAQIVEYKLYTQVEEESTLLLNKTTADAEANRRLDLWSVPRKIVTAIYYAHMLEVTLGQSFNITHPRFGLDAGVSGTVVSIERDWVRGRVTIGVLI